MSKIICDVCGTSYPETATQCPICGCVRSVMAAPLADDNSDQTEFRNGTYIYTKGGRFSKANVNKRNRGINAKSTEISNEEEPQNPSSGNDKGLVIVILALLLAIVGVAIFIVVRYFAPGTTGSEPITVPTIQTTAPTTQPETTEATEATTTAPTEELIPCEEVSVSNAVVEFDAAGESVLLAVSLLPEDTNETLIFTSSDESVAVVTNAGAVTAVAHGEAVITISCGDATAQCRVVCTFEDTDPTEDTTEPTTEPVQTEYDPSLLKLNCIYFMVDDPEVGDVTMANGTTWQAYTGGSGKIPASAITFTSTNTAVAEVDETGLVKAVGSGQAYIKAEYGSKVVECRVICP